MSENKSFWSEPMRSTLRGYWYLMVWAVGMLWFAFLVHGFGHVLGKIFGTAQPLSFVATVAAAIASYVLVGRGVIARFFPPDMERSRLIAWGVMSFAWLVSIDWPWMRNKLQPYFPPFE